MATENEQRKGHDGYRVIQDEGVLYIPINAHGIISVQAVRMNKQHAFNATQREIIGECLYEQLDDIVITLEAGNPDDAESDQLEFISNMRICYDKQEDKMRIFNIGEVYIADPRLEDRLRRVATRAPTFGAAIVGIVNALKSDSYTYRRTGVPEQLVLHDW